MRNPDVVLNNLSSKSNKNEYVFDRLYRNLYNPEFYLKAYAKIYAKEGNMTEGSDGQTIDGFSLERVNNLIEKLKDESYQPKPSKRVYIPKANGKKRPLGVPSFDDKLLQEVIRMILESIYEGKFSDHSHGFRPNKSCHTALLEVQRTFSGSKWFIEGDIKGFFDNIEHHTLIGILEKHINDRKFIRLIWKFLRAGYLEDWNFHNTYSGSPQGGIISPILSNIYLNELDKYISEYAEKFEQGQRKRTNPEYKKLENKQRRTKDKLKKNWEQLSEDERKQTLSELKQIQKDLLNTEAQDHMDSQYKRLKYTRYADDFIIGVIGSKKDCELIKKDLTKFLSEKLKLELSQEKTLITNSRNFARFLGYDIVISRNQYTAKDKRGNLRRSGSFRCLLYVPREKWVNKLLDYKALKITNDGKWKSTHRANLKDNDDLEIISIYNSEIRGLYNYYRLANNVSVLNKFYYIMRFSLYKTLANKYKLSVRKTINKFRIEGETGVKYQTVKGEKIRFFYNKGFRRNPSITKSDVDSLPNTNVFGGRTSLIQRILANTCEHCGKETEQIEVHHVRKLKDLKGKKAWEKFMIARRRKTLALCKQCHVDLHAGRLD